MVYNEEIADRLRKTLSPYKGITEKRMFGGLAFLLYGNMCCGIVGDTVMIRTGPHYYESALQQPYARPMDFTGRVLRNFVYVDPAGIQSDEALQEWVNHAIKFALSLPRKAQQRKKR